MASDTAATNRSRCRSCGFEAPSGADEWLELQVPKLGRMTQCPRCESTDVITGR